MVSFVSVVLTGAAVVSAASIDFASINARHNHYNLPEGWKQVAECAIDAGDVKVFTDHANLGLQRHVFEDNSAEKCLTTCGAQGYGWAALRMGVECWCSATPPNAYPAEKGKCYQQCSGNEYETCGGYEESQVYANPALVKNGPPQEIPESPVYEGWSTAFYCVEDPTVGAVFLEGTDVYQLENNTPYACTEWCGAKGYELAGVEYGNECMCGHNWYGHLPPTPVAETECYMACSGDNTQSCGSGNHVQFYKHGNFKRFNSTLVFDVPF